MPPRAAGATAAALALAAIALLAPAPAAAAPRPLPPRVVAAFGPARGMFARGASDSAYAYLDTLAARAAAAHDDTLRVAALFECGARRAWFGDFAHAIPRLREARARAWALRDSTRWVQSSQWLAYSLHSAGSTAEAGRLANRMLPAAVALGDPRSEGYLRLSAAYCELSAGRATAARPGYRRALAVFESQQDAYGACEAMLGLGRSYSVTGPADSARALFARVVRRAEAARLPRSAASAYNNLAAGEFLAGDPEAATDAWRLAARTMRDAGDLAGELVASGNVCLALTQLGRFEDARAAADSMLQHARRSGSPELAAQAQSRIGLVELNAGRPTAAARCFRTALGAGGDLSLEQRAEFTTGLMQSLVPLDSAAAALVLYDGLLPVVEGHVRPEREAELHTAGAVAAFAAGRAGRAESIARRNLEFAGRANLAAEQIAAERMLARTAAARGRQAEARAHLASAEALWRATRTRATGLEWRTSLSNSARIGSTWAEVGLGHGVERRRARIAPVFAAHERIRSALLLELAAGPGGPRAVTQPVTLDAVQHRVLAAGELLLVAWTGNERSWLLAIARDTALSLPLPHDNHLARDVDLLREAIAAEPPLDDAALDAMLADEGRRLLDPLVPLLRRCRRVVFVPGGALQRLPLEALRVPLGNGGARVALGEARVVSRAPSASLLALARSRPRPAKAADPALLVLVNPGGHGGAELPEALKEARALEERYRGARLLESPRDGDALRAIAGAGAVHVAAHGNFDPASPWRSALQLGDGEPVRARDILAVRLRPELVVLAACETAGGSARGTGGMEGLSAAFLCAGARGVVATLWPVEDRAARRFVEIFYDEAERAPDAATALTRARVKFRATRRDTPVRDWAAFTLVGDPGARPALARKRP